MMEVSLTTSSTGTRLRLGGFLPNPHNKILKLSADGTEAALSKALSLEGERYDVMGTLGIARCQNRSSPSTDFCAHLHPTIVLLGKAFVWRRESSR
jgi:hypothetical protein